MTRPIIAREVTVADMEEFAQLLPHRYDLACDPDTETFSVGEERDGELVPLEKQ